MRSRRAALALLTTTLVAGLFVSPPAEGQSSNYGLRPGLWRGEYAAFTDLEGTFEGSVAVFSGNLSGTHHLLVTPEAEIGAGLWTLTGAGLMEFASGGSQGNVSYVMAGAGSPSGGVDQVLFEGTIQTSSVISGGGVEIPTSSEDPVRLEIPVSDADCDRLEGDVEFPIEQIAAGAGWEQRQIEGFFYAVFVAPLGDSGEDPDDAIFERVDALEERQQEWTDAMLDSGSIDLDGGYRLIAEAQALAADLARANPCLFESRRGPDEFTLVFTLKMALDLADLLQSQEVDGRTLWDASLLVPALGKAGGFQSLIRDQIQAQGQRIVASNMTSGGATCNPCLREGGSAAEAADAAMAGNPFGHTYELDGVEYQPAHIVEAAEVAAGGL